MKHFKITCAEVNYFEIEVNNVNSIEEVELYEENIEDE